MSNQTYGAARKTYSEPILIEYGALGDLTLSGASNNQKSESKAGPGECKLDPTRKPC